MKNTIITFCLLIIFSGGIFSRIPNPSEIIQMRRDMGFRFHVRINVPIIHKAIEVEVPIVLFNQD